MKSDYITIFPLSVFSSYTHKIFERIKYLKPFLKICCWISIEGRKECTLIIKEENFNKKLRDLVNYNKEVDVLEENIVVVCSMQLW